MANLLNKNLIQAVEMHLPANTNTATVLSDILSIGKEAIYRRLRGDVCFTFEEAVKIAQELNISLDQVINSKKTDRTVFDLSLVEPTNLFNTYEALLDSYVKHFKKIANYPDSKLMFAYNTLPAALYSAYKELSKFILFKFQYQTTNSIVPLNYATFSLPANILEKQKTIVKYSRLFANTYYILDWSVFLSIIKDIQYFYKLRVMSAKDMHTVKTDLLKLIDDLENASIRGMYPNGNLFNFYISNIDFESPYMFIEFGDTVYSHIRLFGLSGMYSFNSFICEYQKSWIDSLIKYSILISQSGEIQRAEYFITQRNSIEELLVPDEE